MPPGSTTYEKDFDCLQGHATSIHYINTISDFMLTAHLDLSTICEELAKVKYKWRDIGLKLHVPYHKLKELEEEKNPFPTIIYYWLNGNIEDLPVTWRSIVAVLESSSVDERGLAKTIMDKYCQSEHNNSKGITLRIAVNICNIAIV